MRLFYLNCDGWVRPRESLREGKAHFTCPDCEWPLRTWEEEIPAAVRVFQAPVKSARPAKPVASERVSSWAEMVRAVIGGKK